jgi:cyclic nucleotide gated channel
LLYHHLTYISYNWHALIGSTFGNDLEPTSNWLEVIFSIINVLSGLMLFTLLIGNIQV